MLDLDEREQAGDRADQRHPEVEPQPEDVHRVVDPQRLLEDPEGAVSGDAYHEVPELVRVFLRGP